MLRSMPASYGPFASSSFRNIVFLVELQIGHCNILDSCVRLGAGIHLRVLEIVFAIRAQAILDFVEITVGMVQPP